MEIVLGIYSTPFFGRIKQLTSSVAYPFTKGLLSKEEYYETNTIIDAVLWACKKCTIINFCLDKVYLLLDPQHSYTCQELELVTKQEHFLAKTQFWLNGAKVDKDKVLSIISKVAEQQISFDNLDLNSF